MVLGGDGTLNEAANGLAGSSCALAPLPGGSTNVFARTIGLPNDPIEATGDLLDALAHDSIHRVGLGSVNGRYFLFHVGMGFDAAVVAQVERRSGLKRYAGHPLFVYAGFDTWIRHYDRSRPRFSVRFADGSVVDDGYLCICLNTNPYTYLGNRPLNLAHEATLERGLAVVTLRTLAFAKTMRIIGSALGTGQAPAQLALDRPPHRPHGPRRHRLRPVPVPGRRRPPRRHRAPRDHPRARRARPRRCPGRAASDPAAAQGDVGDVGDDGVDAEVGEPPDAVGVVAGPGVDLRGRRRGPGARSRR